jgi:heptosyltransferase II
LEILNKEKILVIQTAFLGDAVLTLPMIQKLKEKFVNSYLLVLCIPSTRELFAASPFVDECIVYDKRGQQKSFYNFIKMIKLLRSHKLIRIYSPHRSFRSSLISFFSNAGYTFGFDIAHLSFLYKKKIKYVNNHHEVARNLELIDEDVSAERWRILPVIKINEDTEEKIKGLLDQTNDRKIAAIAPGSVWLTKIYPQEYFVEIVKYLISMNYFIVLVGGKDDENLCSAIKNFFPSNCNSFAGKLNVIESVALLRKCSILISNDSAPTHLGMIADIPTLTIFCSTIPAFGFYPYNKKSECISYDLLDCKPCGIHGYKACPIKTFDCGVKLIPEKIFTKINRISLL